MSEKYSEESEMSSATDIQEMRTLVEEIADLKAVSANWKDRVSAIASAIGVGWSRAKGFYYGEVRRVDGFEKDKARKALSSVRAEYASRELRRQLIATAEHLEQMDPGRYRSTVAAIRSEASRVGS